MPLSAGWTTTPAAHRAFASIARMTCWHPRRAAPRLVLLWLTTTVVGKWAIGALEDVVGLHWTWLAKPAVELFLGGVGFLLSRHWVYRR